MRRVCDCRCHDGSTDQGPVLDTTCICVRCSLLGNIRELTYRTACMAERVQMMPGIGSM
jgi:hypothetical protein